MRKITAIFLLLGLSAWAQAETMYVSDHLVITLRTGQGSQFQIIKTLASGDRLEVLETTDSGYTKVSLEDGTEGWVRTQYLSDQPVARETLAKAEARLEQYKETVHKLKLEIDSLKKRKAELDTERNELLKDKAGAEKELSHLNKVAAKPILLAKENRDLKRQNVTLSNELDLQRQENQVLKDHSDRGWFVAGAGVLLGGMLLGLVIPKIRWRKKSGWDY